MQDVPPDLSLDNVEEPDPDVRNDSENHVGARRYEMITRHTQFLYFRVDSIISIIATYRLDFIFRFYN